MSRCRGCATFQVFRRRPSTVAATTRWVSGIRRSFLEVDYDKVEKVTGMNVTVVTTAKTDAEAKALLTHLGVPFRRRRGASARQFVNRQGTSVGNGTLAD